MHVVGNRGAAGIAGEVECTGADDLVSPTLLAFPPVTARVADAATRERVGGAAGYGRNRAEVNVAPFVMPVTATDGGVRSIEIPPTEVAAVLPARSVAVPPCD